MAASLIEYSYEVASLANVTVTVFVVVSPTGKTTDGASGGVLSIVKTAIEGFETLPA